MIPHVFSPRVILNEFRTGPERDSPVLVMNRFTKEIKPRGVNNPVFLGEANYLGDGQKSATLESVLACNDENSIKTIIDMARNGSDMTQYLPELKFFLGNHAARNPHFRKHPKVTERNIESSEEFHTKALDHFPEHYINHPIKVFHIKTPGLSLILPDFSLTHAILAPDVAILRLKAEDSLAFLRMAAENEKHFVQSLNYNSLQQSQVWVVCNSMTVLEELGGINRNNSTRTRAPTKP